MEDKNQNPSQLEPVADIALDSATLARLIEEVRNEQLVVNRSYDRTHNRHNR